MEHERYTLEFKLEAVRLVKAGQEASVTARVALPLFDVVHSHPITRLS
jgi:transposase-like protein